MRIALFHNAPSGGAKRAIYEWVVRLARGHQIDVYTISTADHLFCDIRPFVNQHFVFEFVSAKLFASPWGRLNQLQRWRDLTTLTRLGARIAREIDRGHYDVVFANVCSYTFVPTCLQFVKTPSVFYLHEPFGPRFSRTIERPYLQKNSLRRQIDRIDPLIGLYQHRLNDLQTKGLRRTTKILSNSNFTREHIRLNFGIETPVCPVGVNTQGFQPIANVPRESHVLSVGELTPRKGFDFVIQSLGKLPPAERPNLVLACHRIDPFEREYIEALAKQHAVRLTILLNLSMEELAIQYSQAQVCAYAPILEPFGLVPLEAMACETPVVGVCEGGVQESVVHEYTGLLVERNIDQFADAIHRLLTEKNLATEYGRNGRKHVLQNWTWEQSAHKLEAFLIECAKIQSRSVASSQFQPQMI
jgi:glycosyltransferase involved in cell wall biosynthesis